MADPARAAVNQHALPGLQLAIPEQALPRGKTGQRHRSRGDEIERARFRRRFTVLDDGVFGVTAAVDAQHGENRVAFFPVVDETAAGLDDTGNFAPGHIGQVVGLDCGIFALADLVVDRIHPGRHDFDQQLLFAEIGPRQLLHFQDSGAAESVKALCLH